MEWWKKNKARLEQVYEEYGKIALFTYLSLWAMVLAAYFIAIAIGMDVEGVGETSSVLVGSWVAAKLTQIPRVMLTIVLTPFVARVVRKTPKTVASGKE